MSTFSENNNVQSDHSESDRRRPVQPHSIASSDDVLAGNTPALANQEATALTSANVLANIDGQNILSEEADNTTPAPNPAADRNQSGETAIADKLALSDKSATSKVKLQISGVKLRIDPTHDLVREKTEERSIRVSVVEWDWSGPKLLLRESIHFLGKRCSVPELLPALKGALLLPTGLEDYGTTRDLFESVRELLNRYLALINHQNEILAYWCIASWFPDSWTSFHV